jgi:hypothetical protein
MKSPNRDKICPAATKRRDYFRFPPDAFSACVISSTPVFALICLRRHCTSAVTSSTGNEPQRPFSQMSHRAWLYLLMPPLFFLLFGIASQTGIASPLNPYFVRFVAIERLWIGVIALCVGCSTLWAHAVFRYEHSSRRVLAVKTLLLGLFCGILQVVTGVLILILLHLVFGRFVHTTPQKLPRPADRNSAPVIK